MSDVFIDETNLQGSIIDTAGERLDKLESKMEELRTKELPTQFVFLNKSLNMSSGKAAAQAAHAIEELVYTIFTDASQEKIQEYKKNMSASPRSMIVLQVEDTEELYKLDSYLNSQDIWTGIYVDELANGQRFVPTALAVEYLDRNEIKAKLLSGMYEKFTSKEELKTERYEKALLDIEAMAIDAYFGGFFAAPKNAVLNIKNKVEEVRETK